MIENAKASLGLIDDFHFFDGISIAGLESIFIRVF